MSDVFINVPHTLYNDSHIPNYPVIKYEAMSQPQQISILSETVITIYDLSLCLICIIMPEKIKNSGLTYSSTAVWQST